MYIYIYIHYIYIYILYKQNWDVWMTHWLSAIHGHEALTTSLEPRSASITDELVKMCVPPVVPSNLMTHSCWENHVFLCFEIMTIWVMSSHGKRNWSRTLANGFVMAFYLKSFQQHPNRSPGMTQSCILGKMHRTVWDHGGMCAMATATALCFEWGSTFVILNCTFRATRTDPPPNHNRQECGKGALD